MTSKMCENDFFSHINGTTTLPILGVNTSFAPTVFT